MGVPTNNDGWSRLSQFPRVGSFLTNNTPSFYYNLLTSAHRRCLHRLSCVHRHLRSMRARPAQWQSRNKQKGKARYRRVETTGRRTVRSVAWKSRFLTDRVESTNPHPTAAVVEPTRSHRKWSFITSYALTRSL